MNDPITARRFEIDGELTITRRFEIDTGHRLLKHQGKCRNLHGHRYVFDVTVSGQRLNEVGVVIDFSDLKAVVGRVLERFDHAMVLEHTDPLADIIAADSKTVILPYAPTVENLVQHIGTLIFNAMPSGIVLRAVRAYETPGCWADWTL